MNDQLIQTAQQLRLSGLLQTLDVRLQEARANQLTHAEFLTLLFQDELAIRAQRLIARRKKLAGFRDTRTLEDFDWNFM
ncbi:MAG: ATP-binding protein [Verrucomicrobiae bacterium]|nr:ATP-binding protein [Verrucomicrobiae bacterium]